MSNSPQKPSEATPQQLQKLAIKIAGQGCLRIHVNGVSMLPACRPGDTLLVDSGLRHRPETGQILTFLVGDTMVTHRLVGKTGASFLLKGDNAWHFDSPVNASQLVGCVIAVESRGRERMIRNGFGSRAIAALSRWEGMLQEKLRKNNSNPVKYMRAALHHTVRVLIWAVTLFFFPRLIYS